MDILTYAPIILLVVMLVLLALILKKLAGQKIDPAAISVRFDDLLKGQERADLKTSSVRKSCRPLRPLVVL